MNLQEINKRIAIACGWKPHPNGVDWYEGELNIWKSPKKLPNYHGDLNAMHEAEKVLTKEQDSIYRAKLADIFCRAAGYEWDDGYPGAITATAAQRAEAFLRTIGKWEDDK